MVIAGIIVIACLIMRFCGINSEVWSLMLVATGWLFGGSYQNRKLLQTVNGK